VKRGAPAAVCLALAVAVAGAARAWSPSPSAELRLQQGGVVAEVHPGAAPSSGIIHAAIDIRAPAAAIWTVMMDCARASRMVAYVKQCKVVEADPAGLWDVREHLVEYGFPFPRLRSLVRTEYLPGRRASFRCLPGGDLKKCDGEWRLESLPDGVVRVIYENRVVSPFPAPGFMVRRIFKKDVVKALGNLRREALAGP